MEETATWCCIHIKEQASSSTYSTCGRSVSNQSMLPCSPFPPASGKLTSTFNVSLLLQGRHATSDEIAASAFQAVNIDNKYNGAPVQVRVVMGKEPRHFLAIFKGKLIIFEV